MLLNIFSKSKDTLNAPKKKQNKMNALIVLITVPYWNFSYHTEYLYNDDNRLYIININFNVTIQDDDIILKEEKLIK